MTEWVIGYGNIPSNASALLECSLFGNRILLPCDNDVAKQIMRHQPFKVRRPSHQREAIRSVGADGFFNAEGDDWKQQRPIIGRPLNMKNVRDYLPTIRIVARRLINKGDSHVRDTGTAEATFAVAQDVNSYPIDVLSLIAFNRDADAIRSADSVDAKDLRRMLETINTRMLIPVSYWWIPLIGPYLDAGAAHYNRLIRNMNSILSSSCD